MSRGRALLPDGLRVGVAEFFHETNVYSSIPTTTARFADFRLFRGAEVVANDRGTRTFVAGMLDAIEEAGGLAVPLVVAAALPSGLITADTLEALTEELLDACRAGHLDALCISLHGAAMAEGEDDVDGLVLARLRATLGSSLPLVATLDLHGNVTDQMCRSADGLLGTNLYPHSDSYERGRESVEMVAELVTGEIRPAVHFVSVPMLIPPSTTDSGPALELLERTRHWERARGLREVQVYHGFPMTDCPFAGASVVAISDDDPSLAAAAAEDVADQMWRLRSDFLVPSLSPDEAIDQALRSTVQGAPVVINECSDNAGGGTPGDGTHLLRAMIDRGLTDVAFGTICDPDVAAQAHAAGAGAEIDVALGAKVDPLYGTPIEARATVHSISNGEYRSRSSIWGDMLMQLGTSARLRIGGVDVIVVSVRLQVYDDGPFAIHGIDVAKRRLVALKSNNHFRAWWRDHAAAIITCDPPGGTSTNVAAVPHRRVRRPIWPHDLDFSWSSGRPGSDEPAS